MVLDRFFSSNNFDEIKVNEDNSLLKSPQEETVVITKANIHKFGVVNKNKRKYVLGDITLDQAKALSMATFYNIQNQLSTLSKKVDFKKLT